MDAGANFAQEGEARHTELPPGILQVARFSVDCATTALLGGNGLCCYCEGEGPMYCPACPCQCDCQCVAHRHR